MRYCPQCKDEYREGFDECAECKIPLVENLIDFTEKELSLPPESPKIELPLVRVFAFISIFGSAIFIILNATEWSLINHLNEKMNIITITLEHLGFIPLAAQKYLAAFFNERCSSSGDDTYFNLLFNFIITTSILQMSLGIILLSKLKSKYKIFLAGMITSLVLSAICFFVLLCSYTLPLSYKLYYFKFPIALIYPLLAIHTMSFMIRGKGIFSNFYVRIKKILNNESLLKNLIKTYAWFILIFAILRLLNMLVVNANIISIAGSLFAGFEKEIFFTFLLLILNIFVYSLTIFVGINLIKFKEKGKIWAIKRAYIGIALTIISTIAFKAFQGSLGLNMRFLTEEMLNYLLICGLFFGNGFNLAIIKFFSRDKVVKFFN